MAFCPNCGTPNTDQAEKCVSCAFELKPKAQAKFKGTIMMSGVSAPTTGKPQAAPPAPAPAPAATAAQPPAPSSPPGKSLGFEKTMLGGMAMMPPAKAPGPSPAPAGAFSSANQTDIGRAATLEQAAPPFPGPPVETPALQPPMQPPQQNAAAVSPAPSLPPSATPPSSLGANAGSSPTGGFGGGFSGGGFTTTGDIPMPPKNNTGKILAIAVAALLVLACVVGGAIFLFAKKSIEGLSQEGPALEWRTRVAQSLTNVRSLCQQDCAGAAVYFHPQKQTELVAQAKGLSARALGKLVDPTQSEARMLDATDDQAVATGLGLDPQQCVRIVSGSAKVVGCSVPEPSGTASLRIVHLEGLAAL
jgi:hypothetical protein